VRVYTLNPIVLFTPGVGIPSSGIALIMGVDRILDMSRTAINVSGDLVAAKLMDRWAGGRTSAREQVAAEAEREEIRRSTGRDVITVAVGANE